MRLCRNKSVSVNLRRHSYRFSRNYNGESADQSGAQYSSRVFLQIPRFHGGATLRCNVKKLVFAVVIMATCILDARADVVIDTVALGEEPWEAIAIGSVTNMIYVADYNNGTVTKINGLTNSITTINVRTYPCAIAVNPVTNMVYVADFSDSSVTVINGATNNTTNVNVGLSPLGIAIDSVTDMIYVANYGSNTVTAINGSTNATNTIPTGTEPFAIAVNSVSSK